MQGRKRIRPRFWGFMILAITLCFSLSCAVSQLRYVQASRHTADLQSEKMQWIDYIESLSARLDYVRSDAYVERVARDELSMVMPGEIRYICR